MRFSLHVFADKRASARLLLFQKLQNSVEQRLQKMSSVFLPTLMTWTFPFTTKLCTIGNNSYEINGNFSKGSYYQINYWHLWWLRKRPSRTTWCMFIRFLSIFKYSDRCWYRDVLANAKNVERFPDYVNDANISFHLGWDPRTKKKLIKRYFVVGEVVSFIIRYSSPPCLDVGGFSVLRMRSCNHYIMTGPCS